MKVMTRALGSGLALAIAMTLLAASAIADPVTTYTYTGNAFTTFTPGADSSQSFTCTLAFCGIEGSFTMTGTLGDYLNYTPASPTKYSFTDGQDTFNQNNSSVLDFLFVTNGTGNITGWDIGLQQGGGDYSYFYSQAGYTFPNPGDFAYEQSDIGGSSPELSNSTPGVWTSQQQQVTPEPASWLLLGTGALGLLGVAGVAERRRRAVELAG